MTARWRFRREVSPIEFRLDLASGVPTYLQIVQQVEHALRLGSLGPGDQLPKVRDVVAKLAINPNTVLKAYRELETKGLAVGRPGRARSSQARSVRSRSPSLPSCAAHSSPGLRPPTAGLDEDGMAALVASVLRDFREHRGGGTRRIGGRGMNVIETHALGKSYGSHGRCATARWRSPTGTSSRSSGRTAPESPPC